MPADADVSGAAPLRYFCLLNWLQEELQTMPVEQLKGAVHVLGIVSEFMENMYFEQHVNFDRRAMVKTIIECFEAGGERLAAETMAEVAPGNNTVAVE